MTKQEIINSNKLIAEFMGYIYSGHAKAWGIGNAKNIGERIFNGKMYKNVIKAEKFEEKLFFHSSWDWLMPVIAKCTKSFEHHQYDSEKYYHITEEIFHPDYCLSEFMNNNIMAIFERVVMYIKWYNEHKKVNPESIYGNDMMQG